MDEYTNADLGWGDQRSLITNPTGDPGVTEDVNRRKRREQMNALTGADSQAEVARQIVGTPAPTQDPNKTSGIPVNTQMPLPDSMEFGLQMAGGEAHFPGSASQKPNTFSGPKDPRLADMNKKLRSAGETEGPIGQGDPNADYERQFDLRQGQSMEDRGSHVYLTDAKGNMLHDYTSKATNPSARMLLGEPTDGAPRYGTEGSSGEGYQNLPSRMFGQTDPLGGDVRRVKTVDHPGVSMIQGTPQQQQELHYEDLRRQNAISEQEYQQQYLNMSPMQRAQTQAQLKAASDPRIMAQQQGLAIYQEGIARSKDAVLKYQFSHPHATEEELRRVHDNAFQDYKGALEYLQGLFNNKQQFPGEYTAAPSQTPQEPY